MTLQTFESKLGELIMKCPRMANTHRYGLFHGKVPRHRAVVLAQFLRELYVEDIYINPHKVLREYEKYITSGVFDFNDIGDDKPYRMDEWFPPDEDDEEME